MKLLVIGDLHGRKPVIRHKDFDAFVLVGDICDDRDIAPFYRNFFGLLKEAGEDEKISFEEFLLGMVQKEGSLEDSEKSSLKKGNEILRYLDTFNKPIFMVAGNWDQSYGPTRIKDMDNGDYSYLKTFLDWWAGEKLNPELIKGVKNIKNCLFKNHEFNGINIVGYGHSSGPEKLSRKRSSLSLTKSERAKLNITYNKLRNKLKEAYGKRVHKKFPTLFITHNVPYDTKLDIIKDKNSYAYKNHAGSTIAREFCDTCQPLICVGGHIHENPGKVKIKNTLAINAGYGARAQVLIDIDEKKGRVRGVGF